MNTNALKGKMKERAMTQADVASSIGISISRFNAKLNNSAEFTLGEVRAIKELLALTSDQIDSIFFSWRYLEKVNFDFSVLCCRKISMSIDIGKVCWRRGRRLGGAGERQRPSHIHWAGGAAYSSSPWAISCSAISDGLPPCCSFWMKRSTAFQSSVGSSSIACRKRLRKAVSGSANRPFTRIAS